MTPPEAGPAKWPDPPPIAPLADPARLEALTRTGLLEGDVDVALDRLARLVARVVGAPAALATMVGVDRQAFPGLAGLPEPWASSRRTARSHSFCQYVVRAGVPLVVRDGRDHPWVRENLAIPELRVVGLCRCPPALTRRAGARCLLCDRPPATTLDRDPTRPARRSGGGGHGGARAAGGRSGAAAAAGPAAALGHELCTPLTAILGYAELLEGRWEALGDRERRGYVGQIARSAERQRRPVADLLLLSQLEGSALAARAVALPLMPVVAHAIADIAGAYLGQQVSLAGLPALRVRADPDYLAQIVINLLDNAAKYTQEGSSIRLAWRAEGDAVVLRVEDEDPGIPIEGRERLSTRFGRLGRPLRAGRDSTGLGLYLSRQLAEAMGGSLDLEDTGPSGSTFRLRLPIA